MLNKYGVMHSMQNTEISKKAKRKYTYNGLMFDSKYEIIFYKYLEANNIMFEYHPNICFEYVYDGKTHVYYPDFLVNGELIEIKGLQFFENHDVNCK